MNTKQLPDLAAFPSSTPPPQSPAWLPTCCHEALLSHGAHHSRWWHTLHRKTAIIHKPNNHDHGVRLHTCHTLSSVSVCFCCSFLGCTELTPARKQLSQPAAAALLPLCVLALATSLLGLHTLLLGHGCSSCRTCCCSHTAASLKLLLL